MLSAAMDSDFANSGTDRGHRFPVGRVKSGLHQIEFVLGSFLRIRWKIPDIGS